MSEQTQPETGESSEKVSRHLAEYRNREQARTAEAARLAQRDAQLGMLRLLLALAFLGLAWWGWHGHRSWLWLLVLPVACFVGVAAVQARTTRRRKLALRAVAMYQAGMARMEDRWAGTGQQEQRGAWEGSLFAADLDLFGRQSLFALLSTARTRMGEDALANWLLRPAPLDEIARRHAAVVELRERLDLREDAGVLGADAGSAVDAAALVGWAEEPAVLAGRWPRVMAAAVALLSVAAVVAWVGWGQRLPLLAMLVVAGGIHVAYRRRVQQVMRATDRALADLDLLAALLARLELEPYQAPRLVALQAMLRGASGALTASAAIAKLRSLGAYMDARDNLFVKAANVPLLYVVQVAYAAEHWREVHGAHVRRWLAAVGELEALLSLAAYSYERPLDPFPELAPEAGAGFIAEALGHPLLPAGRCVRNDVALTREAPLVLISGSNMSGKSTLLRAVGLNAVLAMAGAPVRAGRLRTAAVEVGASILVNDSLAEGASRFYAEITRLRAICDRAAAEHGAPQLLFLLDELLEGTNSRDRRTGAEGILRTLAARGATGLVTTHDLALTEGHGDLRLVNRHFEDSVRDDRMVFDYTLRAGVVSRSNGVALMRLVGLDV